MGHRRIAPPLAVLFLILLLSTAARPSLAQPSNGTSSSSSRHHDHSAGGFTPTTVIVLVALVSAFVFLTLFSVYINRCAPTRPPPARRPPRYAPPDHHQPAGGAVHPAERSGARAGIDREVVESFPTAVYGDVKARVAAKSGPLECAVCLAAFADDDELRVLPACFHVFHPDCIDPWLAAAVTCPLCRADLTPAATAAVAPYSSPPPHFAAASEGGSSYLAAAAATAHQEVVREEETTGDEEQGDEACLVTAAAAAAAAFTPEFGAARPHEFHYRRTQSAMDVPDRHTLRLPGHVMKELAAVRRHRRASSLAGYPDAVGVDRTPGWLASFWRSVSWQRPISRTDPDAAVDEHGGGKRVFPVTGAPAETPSGSGAATDDKEKFDHDALNQV